MPLALTLYPGALHLNRSGWWTSLPSPSAWARPTRSPTPTSPRPCTRCGPGPRRAALPAALLCRGRLLSPSLLLGPLTFLIAAVGQRRCSPPAAYSPLPPPPLSRRRASRLRRSRRGGGCRPPPCTTSCRCGTRPTRRGGGGCSSCCRLARAGGRGTPARACNIANIRRLLAPAQQRSLFLSFPPLTPSLLAPCYAPLPPPFLSPSSVPDPPQLHQLVVPGRAPRRQGAHGADHHDALLGHR
jgi:hypothetical protein